jgi:Xaa-Pro dipeptidase
MHEEPPEPPATRRGVLAAGVAAGLAAACRASPDGASGSSGAPAARSAADEREHDRVEELLSGLTDQRSTVTPITGDERAARRKRLGGILAGRGIDAILCEGGATMTYLAGVSWGKSERFFGLVVLADGSCFWISPAFEASRARLQIEGTSEKPGPGGEIVAWQEDEHPYRPLADALERRSVSRIAIEPSLRFVFAERLAQAFGRERVDGESGPAILLSLRGRKDAHEIALLRRANELTQQAVLAASRCLEPGMTGSRVSAIVDRAHKKLGFGGSWNLSLLGPAAALPHGEPDERRLERGSVVLVDAGGDFLGYQSDDTRTWVFDGAPPVEVERAWNAVRDAQLAAFEAIRPGVLCGDVDRAARAKIVEHGFAGGYAAFTHRLGHGIGVEGHEDPYFDSGSAVPLAPGMTLSDEPGLYFPGRFGIRLEDVVLVTEDGADHFGAWQRSPVSPE